MRICANISSFSAWKHFALLWTSGQEKEEWNQNRNQPNLVIIHNSKTKFFWFDHFCQSPTQVQVNVIANPPKKQQIDKFIWNHSINQFWYRMPMAKLHQSLIVQACVLQFNVSKSSELILYIKRANKIKAINSLVFFGFWKVDLNQRYSLIFCCFDFWKYEFYTQRNDSKYIIKYSKWTWCSA